MSEPILDPDFPPDDPIPPEYPEPEPGPELPVADGWTEAEISGARVNVFDAPIVAGDPAGARIEIRSTGFHAFNGTGVETAHIDGAEGVFVGGEFRTSDTLPGQVTLSDSAAQGKPGLSIEPEDATGYDVLPSIGPDAASMHIRGGVATDGSLAGATFDPTGSSIYHNGPGTNGTGSWALVNGGEARLAYRNDRTNAAYESGIWVRPGSAQFYMEDEQGNGVARAGIGHVGLDYYPGGGSSGAHSRIRASTTDVVVSRRNLDGVRRGLRVDDTGVWVDFNTGPFTDTLVSHNLLPTVTTSPFTMPAGWEPDGANVAKYTITGGACYWAGVIKSTGTVASGWTTLGYAPEDAWPKDGDQLRTLPTTSGRTVLGKISATDGRIEIWINQSSTGVFMHFSPFTYLV